MAIGPSVGPRFAVYNGRSLWRSNDAVGWNNQDSLAVNSTGDLFINRDAANTLAQRNGAAAQTFRLYTTVGGTGNVDFERLFLKGNTGGAFQIGTEKGGTGLARALEFQTDGVTRMTLSAGGGAATFVPDIILSRAGGVIQASDGIVQCGSTRSFNVGTRSRILSPADSLLLLQNSALDNFDRLQFGGTTSSFPALKRSSTSLQVKLADDSAFTAIQASNLVLTDNTGSETATFDAQGKLSANRTYDLPDASGTLALTSLVGASAELVIACSDETSNLTEGTAKVTFRMPYAMTLSSVRASVNTAPTDSTLIVDINEGGSTILSTKLSIDASELTSTTAATAAVISDTALADDAEITIDIDQIGSTIAGKGLKVVLKGTRA
jgi:hypothetical protein